jgi:hypothetical protein
MFIYFYRLIKNTITTSTFYSHEIKPCPRVIQRVFVSVSPRQHGPASHKTGIFILVAVITCQLVLTSMFHGQDIALWRLAYCYFSAWEASSADNGFTVHGLLVDVGAASWSTRQLHHLSRGCSSLPANASSTRQMTAALQRSCWLGNRHWPGTPLGEGTNPWTWKAYLKKQMSRICNAAFTCTGRLISR